MHLYELMKSIFPVEYFVVNHVHPDKASIHCNIERKCSNFVIWNKWCLALSLGGLYTLYLFAEDMTLLLPPGESQ